MSDTPTQRGAIIATEIDPQPDYDIHYTICHLHPDDITAIADAVIARLTRNIHKPPTEP